MAHSPEDSTKSAHFTARSTVQPDRTQLLGRPGILTPENCRCTDCAILLKVNRPDGFYGLESTRATMISSSLYILRMSWKTIQKSLIT